MIVFWVILGILTVILLLLCFPVALHLSYQVPEKKQGEKVPYKTKVLQKEIEELGLCEEDKQILLGEVEKLGNYEKIPEKDLTISLHYLFFKIPLFPVKKREAVLQENKQEQAGESQPKQSKKKEKTLDIKSMLVQIWSCAKKPLAMIVNGICLKRLWLDINVSGEDTAESALSAQKLVTAVYSGLGIAQNYIRVKKAEIQIRPDWKGEGKSDWQGAFAVQIRPIVVLTAVLRFGFCFVFAFVSKKKEINSTDSEGKSEKFA